MAKTGQIDELCVKCGLYARGGAKTPCILPAGSREPEVYCVGLGPGKEEDKVGKPFVGPSGKLLRKVLAECGVSRARFGNAVGCIPPNNKVRPEEIEICRVRVLDDIARHPANVLALGNEALEALFPQRPDNVSITRIRGAAIPHQELGVWVVPTYHPSYMLRAQGDEVTEKVWRLDIKKALQDFGPLPHVPEPDITYVTSGDLLTVLFDLLWKADVVAFDFETTTLKPFISEKNSDPESVWSVGFCIEAAGEVIVAVVPLWQVWSSSALAKFREKFKHWLENSPATKIVHNLSFELVWSMSWFGAQSFSGTWHDTQCLAWLLTSEPKRTKLKIVAWEHLGVAPWAIDVKRLLRSRSTPQEILRYNALDAYYTYHLFRAIYPKVQQDGLDKIYRELYIPSCLTFAEMEHRGVLVDRDALGHLREELVGKLNSLMEFIEKESGGVIRSLTANAQIVQYCRDSGYQLVKRTKTGFSVDEESLSDVIAATGDRVLEAILEARKLAKLCSTYVESIEEGLDPQGRSHPSYSLTGTATGRSSSSNPNIQNIPKRDATQKIVRKIFVPPEGKIFVACDYGQIEARLFGAVSGDPTFCQFLRDGYDIHLDFSRWLFGEELAKERRSRTKNAIFAAFYGAGVQKLATVLQVDETKAAQFRNRLFETFPQVKSWLRKSVNEVMRKGYAESIYGIRRYLPMPYNAIINHPIQSSAAFMTLFSMVCLRKMGYEIAFEIHDDLTFIVDRDQVERALEDVVPVMLSVPWLFVDPTKIKSYVPLAVEISVGSNWFDLEELSKVEATDLGLSTLADTRAVGERYWRG